jgi:putative endonuclease
MAKQPCVYIMASKKHGYVYIGVTSNLSQRVHQHRHGLIAGCSKEAILREKQLKNWHRDWKINLIEGDNPDWLDLASGLGLDS